MTQPANDRSTVHRAAVQGYTANADSYVLGRPDYPPALAGWLTDTLGLKPGASVVDLGAGTGKFTPRLLQTGARVIAVEPVDSMRVRLAAALPDVEALAGTAQSMPLGNASVDAVQYGTTVSERQSLRLAQRELRAESARQLGTRLEVPAHHARNEC